MQWFGKSWGAPICDIADQIDTPVGEDCGYCDKLIEAGDIGLRMPFMGDPTGRGYMNTHHECFMRAVIPPEMLDGA